VAGVHDPGDQLVTGEHRQLDEHVLRVQPAAVVRIVGEEHIAGSDRIAELGEGRAHRMTAYAEMVGDRAACDDEVAVGFEQRAGVVA
jgi:hypothetical protein